MNGDKESKWSYDQAPMDVLIGFLQEVKNGWVGLSTTNWTKIGSKEIAGEELCVGIKRVHNTLLSLSNLIAATRHYTEKVSLKFKDDPELDRLKMIAHDWAATVFVAKNLSQALLQEDNSKQESWRLQKFLRSRLEQINDMVKKYSDTFLARGTEPVR